MIEPFTTAKLGLPRYTPVDAGLWQMTRSSGSDNRGSWGNSILDHLPVLAGDPGDKLWVVRDDAVQPKFYEPFHLFFLVDVTVNENQSLVVQFRDVLLGEGVNADPEVPRVGAGYGSIELTNLRRR